MGIQKSDINGSLFSIDIPHPKMLDPTNVLPWIPHFLIEKEEKINIFYDIRNHTRLLSFCWNCGPMKKIDYIPSITTINSTYAILKNVYISKSCGFALHDTQIMTPGCYPVQLPLHWPTKQYPRGKVIGEYSEIIAVGNKHCDTYGHLYDDYIAPLLLVPENIRNTVKIIVPGTENAAIQLLHAIGIRDDQMVFMGLYDWIYAHKVHTIYSYMSHFAHFSTVFIQLANILAKHYNLSDAPPSLYALYNRKPKMRRYITNFKEIVSHVRKTFPMYDWAIIETQYSTIYEAAIAWRPIKFLFAVAGSHLQHLIFMRPKTALLTFMGNWGDYPVLAAAQTIGIWLRIFFQDFDHGLSTELTISSSLVIKELRILFYAIENDKWPDTESRKLSIRVYH